MAIESSSGAPSSTSPELLSPQELLGRRYRIERFLARGGMAEIYLAHDLVAKRQVALKALPPMHSSDPELVLRFERELALAKRVEHPNVCELYEIEQHRLDNGANILFLTMEYLPGETLKQSLERRGPYAAEEAAPLVRPMADGLAALHDAEVIHRDFKSSNVFLAQGEDDEGRVVVTDFGISRALDKGTTITEIDTYIGSPLYMAPEQLEGGAITPATDVYAFGLVLYEMTTGTLPFLAERKMQIIMRRLTEKAEPPSRYAPNLPSSWESVILRCLSYSAEDRYQDVFEAVSGLESGADGAED